MSDKLLHKPLYLFLILGLLFWGFLYTIIPAKPTYSFSTTTLVYIIISLLAYILGHLICHKFYKIKTQPNSNLNHSKNIIWFLITLVIISWFIRYIDLFFSRGISFSNTIQENRDLLGIASSNPIYIFGAIFKELFFLPLLLTLISFNKNKKLLICSSFLYLLPLLIPFLRGTRKDVFFTFLILALVLIITKTMALKLKTLIKLGVVFIVLNIVFYNLLMNRETGETQTKDQKIDELLDKATYNDLLQPTVLFEEKIKASKGIKKAILFNYVHTLQYYCHGVFELDYLVKDKTKNKDYLKGEYNFNLFLKALEKFNLIEYDSSKVHFILPRQSTYITFLGAMFVDFGWLGIIGMFCLGYFQNVIDKKVKNNNTLYLSLYIFFIMFNIFFPVINLLRGTGIYFVFSCLTIIISLNILFKSKFRTYL
ncbi:O-antigen polysaccharide polymerase Wzy [Flavobacteriaceae bacterium S0825]|uniref:O-antigen polysaccharide polymerase Wzy n=1 Tax=Gaetbulibacter sp. S0825 TaxID=2720084 RepID=UPI001431226B|nr:O-antigen polysaccharide polymerase Wzy [Gaetbulibacter sp. S0825]MCK0108296.1 O-antigen polysaccharide polymerase Wzy [Flavobacteriaceae bacterium S0825]NIX63932.1 O-antigen polysaccharide polymerase Wzy [Gaetbulibacter sp. S0825]